MATRPTRGRRRDRFVAAARRRRRRTVWLRVGLIVALFAVTVVVARSCQQSQVRISKERAIATAEQRVPFKPTTSRCGCCVRV